MADVDVKEMKARLVELHQREAAMRPRVAETMRAAEPAASDAELRSLFERRSQLAKLGALLTRRLDERRAGARAAHCPCACFATFPALVNGRSFSKHGRLLPTVFPEPVLLPGRLFMNACRFCATSLAVTAMNSTIGADYVSSTFTIWPTSAAPGMHRKWRGAAAAAPGPQPVKR